MQTLALLIFLRVKRESPQLININPPNLEQVDYNISTGYSNYVRPRLSAILKLTLHRSELRSCGGRPVTSRLFHSPVHRHSELHNVLRNNPGASPLALSHTANSLWLRAALLRSEITQPLAHCLLETSKIRVKNKLEEVWRQTYTIEKAQQAFCDIIIYFISGLDNSVHFKTNINLYWSHLSVTYFATKC